MSSEYAFPDEQKKEVCRAIMQRRDIKSQFIDKPVSDELLVKILEAAHNAPSVGFMQPWIFLLTRNQERKKRV